MNNKRRQRRDLYKSVEIVGRYLREICRIEKYSVDTNHDTFLPCSVFM